jgi:hypothetical protein
MEQLQALISGHNEITNRTLRQALGFVTEAFRDSAESVLCDIASLLFGANSVVFPANFVLPIKKEIGSTSKSIEFQRIAERHLDSAFWQAERPNVACVLNFSTFFGTGFLAAKSQLFVSQICSHMEEFQLASFKTLPKLVESCLDVNSSKENAQQLLSAFLKVVTFPFCYESVSAVIRIIGQLLNLLHSPSEISDVLASADFTSNFSPLRFIVMQSEIAKTVRIAGLAADIIQTIENNSDKDSDLLIHLTLCGLNVLPIVQDICRLVNLCSKLLIRDYLTSNQYLRLLLENFFSRLLRKAKASGKEKEVIEQFLCNLDGVPIHSPLKKFCMPSLASLTSSDVWSLLRDPQHHSYVSKMCPKRIEFVAAVLAKAKSEYSKESALPSLRAVLHKMNFSELLTIVHRTESAFHRAWFVLEISIANPKSLHSELLREHFGFSAEHGNWDLRLKYFQSFVANQFPKSQDDSKNFFSAFDSILLNDCPNYQSVIVTSFAEFAATREFQLVAELHRKMLPFTTIDWPESYKRFGRELLVPVWKRFPELRPRSAAVGDRPDDDVDLEPIATKLEERSTLKWKVETEMIQKCAAAIQKGAVPLATVRRFATFVFHRILEGRTPGFIAVTILPFQQIVQKSELAPQLTDEAIRISWN